jgi:hypothetical protein
LPLTRIVQNTNQIAQATVRKTIRRLVGMIPFEIDTKKNRQDV